MSKEIDANIARLMDGLDLSGEEHDFCDFTIADQHSATASLGLVPTTPTNFKPELGKNITYIVACVIINESNEVLMMQEAKKSCAGKWYLPAGRMEKDETIVQAAVREVLEETGLECEPTTLLIVETEGGLWYRFVFAARILRGELKTPAKADKESLQAKWIANLQEISLRSDDILHLIEKARLYKQNQFSGSWHNDILPAPTAHVKNLMRLVIVIMRRSTNKLHVLLSDSRKHFVTCEINPDMSVHSTLEWFMEALLGEDADQYRSLGLLNVEHDPESDGCCFSLLVHFTSYLEEIPIIGKCVWQELSCVVENKMLSIITAKKSMVEMEL